MGQKEERMMEPLSRIDNGQIKCEEGLFFYSLLVLPVFSSDVRWGYSGAT